MRPLCLGTKWQLMLPWDPKTFQLYRCHPGFCATLDAASWIKPLCLLFCCYTVRKFVTNFHAVPRFSKPAIQKFKSKFYLPTFAALAKIRYTLKNYLGDEPEDWKNVPFLKGFTYCWLEGSCLYMNTVKSELAYKIMFNRNDY